MLYVNTSAKYTLSENPWLYAGTMRSDGGGVAISNSCCNSPWRVRCGVALWICPPSACASFFFFFLNALLLRNSVTVVGAVIVVSVAGVVLCLLLLFSLLLSMLMLLLLLLLSVFRVKSSPQATR